MPYESPSRQTIKYIDYCAALWRPTPEIWAIRARLTADIVAKRVEQAVHSPVRDAVGESMCRPRAAEGAARVAKLTHSALQHWAREQYCSEVVDRTRYCCSRALRKRLGQQRQPLALGQHCTDLPAIMSHRVTRMQNLTFTFHVLFFRFRSLRAFMAASLRKRLGMKPHDGDFQSRRMCPFCGLLTLRHETSCLECGKSLRSA